MINARSLSLSAMLIVAASGMRSTMVSGDDNVRVKSSTFSRIVSSLASTSKQLSRLPGVNVKVELNAS